MIEAVYRIVEHDGGWAYKLGDVFSETFPSRQAAQDAAKRVAEEQCSPGDDEAISWEDKQGVWHDETARGMDRPNAYVAGGEMLQQPRSGARYDTNSAGAWARSPNNQGRRQASGGEVGRHEGRSDPLIVMLLTIALAYMLGMIVGRKS